MNILRSKYQIHKNIKKSKIPIAEEFVNRTRGYNSFPELSTFMYWELYGIGSYALASKYYDSFQLHRYNIQNIVSLQNIKNEMEENGNKYLNLPVSQYRIKNVVYTSKKGLVSTGVAVTLVQDLSSLEHMAKRLNIALSNSMNMTTSATQNTVSEPILIGVDVEWSWKNNTQANVMQLATSQEIFVLDLYSLISLPMNNKNYQLVDNPAITALKHILTAIFHESRFHIIGWSFDKSDRVMLSNLGMIVEFNFIYSI